ncbi:hypothetical protein D3C84_522070 [compost metagenome]
MAVALGDVGEGVDEATGGQRMGSHLQHPAVVQTLLHFANGPAIGIAGIGAEQRQLAVGHDPGEGAVRLHRRQAAEFEEAVVPEFEDALGADHGHALGQVVHRALQQSRLLRQGLFAAVGLALLHLGDIGVEDHQPAFAGRPLADLHPAAVVQAVEDVVVAAAVFFDYQPGALGQAADLRQPRTAADARAGARPEGLEAAVEEDDALLAVEQHEGVGDAFDGVDQVLMGGFRTQTGVAQQPVAGLELGHGLVQSVGALAHLLGQHHRVLEGRVTVVRARGAGFHPFDQRRVDPLELAVLLLQGGQACLLVSGSHCDPGGRWRLR